MKKTFTSILFSSISRGTLLALSLVATLSTQAQIVTTVAGTGVRSYSGDGGPATAATFHSIYGVAVDNMGNTYIADANNAVIRKVDRMGIVTPFAGTAINGYSGDGGAATLANISNVASGVIVDPVGNVLFCDYGSGAVRKINTAGIITTIAGNGTFTSTGDGGAATAAGVNGPVGMAMDISGNIYVAEVLGHKIRKIDTHGIITTFAGGGIGGLGDGGAATAASLYSPSDVVCDLYGNVYISDNMHYRVRMINPAGIITTIAGNGSGTPSGDGGPAIAAGMTPFALVLDGEGNLYIGDDNSNTIRKVDANGIITLYAGNGSLAYTGDNGPATAASFHSPYKMCMDAGNNMLIADAFNNVIRRTTTLPDYASDSFMVYTGNNCAGLHFRVVSKSYNSTQHITTYFGDGHSFDSLLTHTGAIGYIDISKTYATSGKFTIKHVLYNGTTAVDSISYSHNVALCQSIPLEVYFDSLGTCVFDEHADILNPYPVRIAVDSNGVAIDTVSVTSGLYYIAYGNPGDVYKFRALPSSALVITCPASGVITDTFYGKTNKGYFGLRCMGSLSYDLSVNTMAMTGRHHQQILINAANSWCNPENATLNLTFSPKYHYQNAYPTPSLVSGNNITWDLASLGYLNPDKIQVNLEVPGAWLLPGDTVNFKASITPNGGDVDTSNNTEIETDTVKSSYDPNEIMVSPSWYIAPSTQLRYSIGFENTGNDTAHNIYIIDTLSGYVNPKSLNLISSSANMIITQLKGAGHTIVKFAFPNINLLDSSHHGQCDGLLVYDIDLKPGLPNGTMINNRAGIYFDDNEVVMTNKVTNIIGILGVPTIPASLVRIYPNPVNEELIIENATANTTYKILNLVGQQVCNGTIASGRQSIILHNLPNAPYLLQLIEADGTMLNKTIVKQ